jgi:hypothetical protein
MRELPWKYAREKRFYRLQLTTPPKPTPVPAPKLAMPVPGWDKLSIRLHDNVATIITGRTGQNPRLTRVVTEDLREKLNQLLDEIGA